MTFSLLYVSFKCSHSGCRILNYTTNFKLVWQNCLSDCLFLREMWINERGRTLFSGSCIPCVAIGHHFNICWKCYGFGYGQIHQAICLLGHSLILSKHSKYISPLCSFNFWIQFFTAFYSFFPKTLLGSLKTTYVEDKDGASRSNDHHIKE